MNLGKVGIIFSSGGFTGAYSVGFAKAILAKGIKPEFIQGISVGALNACKLVECNLDTRELEARWSRIQELGQGAIFNRGDIWKNVISRGPSLFFNDRIVRLLMKEIDFAAVVNSPIELQIIIHNDNTGMQEVFSNHDPRAQKDPSLLAKAALASNSIAGFLPPVEINGTPYSDGNVFKISEAIKKAQCDTIFLLLNTHLQAVSGKSFLRRFVFLAETLHNQLAIKKIEYAVEDKGYELIQNVPLKFFDKVRPLRQLVRLGGKLRRFPRRLADALTSSNPDKAFVPLRLGLMAPARLIPTFYTLGFEQARSGYKGDIVTAIEESARIGDDFWAKFE